MPEGRGSRGLPARALIRCAPPPPSSPPRLPQVQRYSFALARVPQAQARRHFQPQQLPCWPALTIPQHWSAEDLLQALAPLLVEQGCATLHCGHMGSLAKAVQVCRRGHAACCCMWCLDLAVQPAAAGTWAASFAVVRDYIPCGTISRAGLPAYGQAAGPGIHSSSALRRAGAGYGEGGRQAAVPGRGVGGGWGGGLGQAGKAPEHVGAGSCHSASWGTIIGAMGHRWHRRGLTPRANGMLALTWLQALCQHVLSCSLLPARHCRCASGRCRGLEGTLAAPRQSWAMGSG
jgi:hypothetical protein